MRRLLDLIVTAVILFALFTLCFFAKTSVASPELQMLLLICATLCFACLIFVGVSGQGLLCRRVEKDEFLINVDKTVYKTFKKTEHFWRWDSIFIDRKLCFCEGSFMGGKYDM